MLCRGLWGYQRIKQKYPQVECKKKPTECGKIIKTKPLMKRTEKKKLEKRRRREKKYRRKKAMVRAQARQIENGRRKGFSVSF